MNRRQFLHQSINMGINTIATLGAASALLGTTNALATQNYNWKLGWASVEQDSFMPLEMHIQGDLPAQLTGSFYRNGPAKHERNTQRYKHWFDGDGMVQKFDFSNGRIVHSGQFVHTPKYKQEEQAQRFLYNGAGTVFANSQPGRNNDSINTANTALQVWDNELLALWEGGSAVSMNLQSLQTNGIKTWHEELANMPFSAHPLIDEKGHMWNFGFAPYAGKTGKIVLYHIAPKTGIKKTHIIDLPFKGYMHDFAQTNQSLIFLVPPFTFTKAGSTTFVDSFQWQPELGSRMLVVNKNDLSKHTWFELPAGFVFHFGHATESNGNLQVNLCWYENGDLMQKGMSELMSSGSQKNTDTALAATIVANLNTGKAKLIKSTTNLEFPGFADEVKHNSTIIGVHRSNKSLGHADTLMAFCPYHGETDYYRYAPGIMVEEPMLVSSKDLRGGKPSHPGYVIQTFLDVGSNPQSGINIFEANNLRAGPIAQATMLRTLPLGFHGTYHAH